MGRKRVPNGKVFLKKEEKILNTLKYLSADYSDEVFIDKFRELYPEDWEKIVNRYNAHERLTPPEKSHPMAPPPKYLLNILRKYRDK